jgi:hypothetical protein
MIDFLRENDGGVILVVARADSVACQEDFGEERMFWQCLELW